MADIIGVKFRNGGKVYYFAPNEDEFEIGDGVVVETARGIECGEVAIEKRTIPDEKLIFQLKPVIRKATYEDLEKVEENRKKEAAAFETCEKRIEKHGLDMKLVSVEYAFDGSKMLFCFTSDGRVDFRELVKDLAGTFRTRIELRQIGVRDEARMLGGLGICGRPFCCATFLNEFQPVSIKMAKEQGLSLNPVKISGTCGRLMCCLKYEQAAYEDLLKVSPRVGATVGTPDGKGVVIDRNLISGTVRVALEGEVESAPKTYHVSKIRFGGKRQEDVSEAEETLSPEEELELAAIVDDAVPDVKKTDDKPAQNRPQNGGRNNNYNRNRNNNHKHNNSRQPNKNQNGKNSSQSNPNNVNNNGGNRQNNPNHHKKSNNNNQKKQNPQQPKHSDTN